MTQSMSECSRAASLLHLELGGAEASANDAPPRYLLNMNYGISKIKTPTYEFFAGYRKKYYCPERKIEVKWGDIGIRCKCVLHEATTEHDTNYSAWRNWICLQRMQTCGWMCK